MGKIRRTRTKRHIEAVKSDLQSDGNDNSFEPNESGLPTLFPVDNLFKTAEKVKESVNITSVKPEIEDEETLHQTKKDRRKIRHEKFLKKLHVSKMVKENDKKAKERQKTVITGDLNPLTLALLDIDNLSSSCNKDKKKRKNTKKPRDKKDCSSSETKKQKAQLSDFERFHQVLAHPTFKSNPLATIDEHVRNVIKSETNES